MRNEQAGWTSRTPLFPGYVNFTVDDDHIVITVRGPAKQDGGNAVHCGETVSMRIPRADFAVMTAAMMSVT